HQRHRGREVERFAEAFQRATDYQMRVVLREGRGDCDERPEDQTAQDERLAPEAVANESGQGRGPRVDPHKRRPDDAELRAGQPHLAFDRLEDREDRLAVSVIEEADEPEHRHDEPFVVGFHYNVSGPLWMIWIRIPRAS